MNVFQDFIYNKTRCGFALGLKQSLNCWMQK